MVYSSHQGSSELITWACSSAEGDASIKTRGGIAPASAMETLFARLPSASCETALAVREQSCAACDISLTLAVVAMRTEASSGMPPAEAMAD